MSMIGLLKPTVSLQDSLSQPLDIHIRVKRKNTVLFIYVDTSETVLELKEKIEVLLGQVTSKCS